jgi:hypothetical protein
MSDILVNKNYTYKSKEIFDKEKGVLVFPVGETDTLLYPKDMMEYAPNIYSIYTTALNDNTFQPGYGMYWNNENIKVVLVLCLKTKYGKIQFDFNVFEAVLISINKSLPYAPVFLHIPFFTEYVDFEWFENYIDNLTLTNKYYFTFDK